MDNTYSIIAVNDNGDKIVSITDNGNNIAITIIDNIVIISPLWAITREALVLSPLLIMPVIVALFPTIGNIVSIIAPIDYGNKRVSSTTVIDTEAKKRYYR